MQCLPPFMHKYITHKVKRLSLSFLSPKSKMDAANLCANEANIPVSEWDKLVLYGGIQYTGPKWKCFFVKKLKIKRGTYFWLPLVLLAYDGSSIWNPFTTHDECPLFASHSDRLATAPSECVWVCVRCIGSFGPRSSTLMRNPNGIDVGSPFAREVVCSVSSSGLFVCLRNRARNQKESVIKIRHRKLVIL